VTVQKGRSSLIDTFFVDTNVLLDYLEKRHKEVYRVVFELLRLSREGKIILATSIFNIAELLEKELDIAFYSKCMRKKMSCDEIIRLAKNKGRSYEKTLENCRGRLESRVKKLIEKNDILLLSLPENIDPLEQVCDLGVNTFLSSQDVMIVTTALANSVTYFLSNDNELVKKLGQNGSFYVFNLRKDEQREIFCNTVLKVVQS